jgi:hypothetical protein
MSNDLENKLTALAEPGKFRDGAMHLGPSGSSTAMAEIIRAIDNTILPRQVELSVGKSSVVISIGGRRLRSLVEASENLQVPDELVEQTLSADSTDNLQAIGQLLQRLLATDGRLTLRRTAGSTASGQMNSGVSVKALAELWGVDLNGKVPSDLEQFQSLLGSNFIASIEVDGQSSSNPLGNANALEGLELVLNEKLEPLEQQLANVHLKDRGRQLFVFEGVLPDAMLLGLAIVDDTKLLIAMSKNSFADITMAWSRTLSI